MTTYGSTSRISVEERGGGISAINIGVEKKHVIFAPGDPSGGSVTTNTPTQVNGPGELESTFGTDQPINEYFRDAAAQGVSYDLLYGVVPSTQSVTGEVHNGTSSFSVGNDPIIEDTSEITVTDVVAGTDLTVEFRYESPPPTGSIPTDTAYINPLSGEVETDTSTDYQIDYKYHDWQSAFDSATDTVSEGELGQWTVSKQAESVISDAQSTMSPLRTNQWKMIHLNGAAQPNASKTTDNDATFDVGNYSDGIDADATYLFAPVRKLDSVRNVATAAGAIMASNDITNPIIGESLQGITDLETTLNVPDQETMEGNGVIPISNAGSPTIEGNVGTSTETDWTRTFFARELADRLLLAARAVAKAARGRLNNVNTETIVEQQLADEIEDLIDDGVLEPNTTDETRWTVNASQDSNNPRELDVSFGFTPTGVVDTVTVTETINY